MPPFCVFKHHTTICLHNTFVFYYNWSIFFGVWCTHDASFKDCTCYPQRRVLLSCVSRLFPKIAKCVFLGSCELVACSLHCEDFPSWIAPSSHLLWANHGALKNTHYDFTSMSAQKHTLFLWWYVKFSITTIWCALLVFLSSRPVIAQYVTSKRCYA